jgi:lysophospholipase L1-like esterase
MRFMFVGDSMTVGTAGDPTWRYWMWRHLVACGTCAAPHAPVPHEVVGPLVDAGPGPGTGSGRGGGTGTRSESGSGTAAPACDVPGFPRSARAHLAVWGEGWCHMAVRIGAAVTAHRPDVLLVSLGLIDLGFYTNSEQTDGSVRDFFAAARAAAPGLRAVVMPVIPNIRARTDEWFAAEVARFNELLAKTVAELGAPPAAPLVLAAPPAGYDIAVDTYDGTHPSASGERKLARAFAEALHQAEWPAAGGPSARWGGPAAG